MTPFERRILRRSSMWAERIRFPPRRSFVCVPRRHRRAVMRYLLRAALPRWSPWPDDDMPARGVPISIVDPVIPVIAPLEEPTVVDVEASATQPDQMQVAEPSEQGQHGVERKRAAT